MSTRVRELLEEYTTKIADELKQELLAAIGDLGFGVSARRSPRSAPTNGHRGKGDKRDPAELDALAERFVGFVVKHPGLRIEQINKQLGTSTKDLALPIRKLLANGRVKRHGHKRSTTYTPGKSGGGKRSRKK